MDNTESQKLSGFLPTNHPSLDHQPRLLQEDFGVDDAGSEVDCYGNP